MPKKAWVEDRLYMDEAEGFLLSHALFSPPRTWPPLAPEPNQSARLQSKAKKMDWEGEARKLPGEDEDMDLTHHHKGDSGSEGEANKERCVICLMELRDRTIVGVCGHEFCFECIGVWANQSRRCPLCSADMAPFLLHDLDSITPTKFYLPPLPSRQIPSISLPGPSRRVMERPHPAFEKAEPDELDLQIERRKEIYQNELYCKHVGSNAKTHYRPNPTPHEIANSPQLIQRTTAFLRRELRVWTHTDVEYLTSHILSLIKAVDVRSDVAVRLLAEYLDPPTAGTSVPSAFTNGGNVSQGGIRNGAEHFAHELYSWLRSPFKELRQWDLVAQYDTIPSEDDVHQTKIRVEADRARSQSPRKPSRSLSPSRSPSRSRSRSVSSRSSRSPSPYSSRSPYSRSPSPLPPRDPTRPDEYVAPPSPGEKQWNQPDTWLDPEYAAWLDDERKRAEERVARRKALRETWETRRKEGMRAWGVPAEKAQVELLPSPPPKDVALESEKVDTGGLTIKGAAAEAPRRLTLLERLAKAKAENASIASTEPTLPTLPDNPAEINAEDLLEPLQPTHSSVPRRSVSGLKETVRARLRLRLKLESERANWRHNIAESKAQELRRRLLEAKVTRQAAETDAVLRKMDRLDWQREVRRRLMVEKILAAETEGERRARELKERLSAEKRRKMLREVLLARKRSLGGEVVAVQAAA